MDVKLIRAFIALAENENYHSAAEALCVTQPALTKYIQTLEKQIGAKLFIRGRHGSYLTATGENLYPKSKEFLKTHNEFNACLNTIKNEKSQKLSIAFGISSYKIAPELVKTFNKRNKNIEISLKDTPSNIQCQLLIEGDIDIGFLRLPVDEKLSATMIMNEHFALAVHQDINKTIGIKSIIQDNNLIMINENASPCLYGLTKNFIANVGLEPGVYTETDDIHTLLALVAAQNGVALLPSAARHFLPPNVTLIPCPLINDSWPIGIAWNPKIKNPLRDSFLELIATIDENVLVNSDTKS
ncbi:MULTISPECIES: LysR family transcriptional regulator [Enterobacterales]|uniref:LysR family transcriptional regulator n=1 Tax=Enterobacterales TaxID=91347 RepID=UPI002ED944C5